MATETFIFISLRQAQVLTGLLAGFSINEIGKQLGTGRDNIHGIIRRLHQKFGVRSTDKLIVKAIKTKSVVDYMPNNIEVVWPGKRELPKI